MAEVSVCSFCEKSINKGEFIAAIGKRANMLKVAARFKFGMGSWPMLDNPQIYCQSCFDKKFKK